MCNPRCSRARRGLPTATITRRSTCGLSADTVVYLDTPWWICAARAFVRGLRRPEGQLPDGCETTAWRRLRDEWWLVWRVWLGRRSERERELAIVARHGGHVALHVLRSKSAIRALLDHA